MASIASNRTPKQRADYYRDKAKLEDLQADRYAADYEFRGEQWHRRNAQSYRDQANCIEANARKND